MEESAEITYTDEDTGLMFRWHGGAYVNVMFDLEAVDVINVWDDEVDRSTFETEASEVQAPRPFRFILESFEDLCRRYLDDQMAEACLAGAYGEV